LKISRLFRQDQDQGQDFFFKTKTFISRPKPIPFLCPRGASRPRPRSRDYIPDPYVAVLALDFSKASDTRCVDQIIHQTIYCHHRMCVTLYIPEDTRTSYLIILVTYINAPLSLVLFMSLYSLYMLTILVFACFTVYFWNSV